MMEPISTPQAKLFQARPTQSRFDGTDVVATATASLMKTFPKNRSRRGAQRNGAYMNALSRANAAICFGFYPLR